jgi:hypothetical protein
MAEVYDIEDRKEPAPKDVSESDSKLLKQIRDDYSTFLSYWREIRDEYAEDMRYVSGHPFTQAEKDERKSLGAPVVEPDEITQYLNQAINNLRQNKRAIKISPAGQKATDKAAEHRAAIIRGIEYQSNAQAAYITGFESMINGSFGAWRITTDYLNDGVTDGPEAFNQAPKIKRIPNAMTVLPDPDSKEADFSDMEKCFVTDTIRKSDFERRYPDAQKRSFSAEDVADAPDWFKGDNLIIAEYWLVEKKKRKVMRVQRAHEKKPSILYHDELSKGETPQVLNERTIESRKVVQYITNGVEILEKNSWVGSRIPIIICYGKELYLSDSGKTKRMWLSLTRLARDPQKMLAFVASQEAEEFGMAPRAPVQGYVGQFETDKEAWDTLNKVRRAYVQVDPVVDQASGQVLPLPTRPQFMPNIDAYEMSREAWRRSVQAAIGTSPLPTAAQRRNEKSGVALQQIQQNEQVGSFHFTDNFDRALQNTGWQLNELIHLVLDTPRQVPVQNKDDSYGMMWVTTSQHGRPSEAAEDEEYLIVNEGQYGVTISTGPSFQSQRDEQGQFVDNIVQNLAQLPPPGSPPAKILALAIRMKNYGALADEICDVLDPQPDENMKVPPQVQAQMANLQQQNKQLDALAQQLQQEKDGKVIDNQFKLEIAKMQEDTKRLQLINQRQIAEIQTKAQDMRERAKLDAELDSDLHVSAHEAATQATEQDHQRSMAEQQHAQALEQQDAGHQQALEQQDQAGAQQAALAQQQAENQPADQ